MRKRKAALAATVLTAVLGAIALPASAATLLSNGSFEAPDIGVGNYTYPGLPYGTIAPIGAVQGGWTYAGAALVNATAGNAWYGGAAPSGRDGQQFVALQGTSTISQAFTASASTLHLGWLDAGRTIGGMGDQSYNIQLNGVAQGGVFSTTSGSSFDFNSLNLTGLTVGGGYTLAFQGLVSGSDQTAFIDGVQLSDLALVLPAAPPSKIIAVEDLSTPAGFMMIDNFDDPIAAGFSFTGGYVRSGLLGLDPGMSAPPPLVLSNYETVLGGQSATLTSARLLSDFSFYMGSPDGYNSVRFLGPNYDFTLNGADIWQPTSGGGTGDQSWGRRITYNFGGYGVNQIVFASAGNSFEFDNLAGRLQAPVPEPATWALMLTGFFGMGTMLRSRRRVLVRA